MVMNAPAIAAVLVALLLTGCGRGASTSTSTLGSAGNDPAQGEGSATVDCGGSVYDADALAEAPPVSSLPKGPTEAVDDAGAEDVKPSETRSR
jgi:hypothetical protein